MKEYEKYDATGLAELVHNGEVTPEELCDAAIKRIEERNPKVNAVVCEMYDMAKESIKRGLPDGPFKGVPFLLKDMLAAHAGVPLTSGCRGFKNFIPKRDSELVTRFKKAGVVILGKTNVPEFGFMGVTEPELFGPCRNPWNTDHTPGGSSGGSASAVGAGMVPFASGGDGGGSIRIPSSCCGLFGLKPTRGRNPVGPDHNIPWQGAVCEHVLTRSVRDSAAMLDATNGADPGAQLEIPKPEKPYVEIMKEEPGKLKIAFTTKSPLGNKVHPECVKSVEDAAKLLESMGHNVEEKSAPVDGKALFKSYMVMNVAEICADVKELEDYMGRKATLGDIELPTMAWRMIGKHYTAEEFSMSLRAWNEPSRAIGNFLCEYDIYMVPIMANPPARVGEFMLKSGEQAALKTVNALGLGKALKTFGIMEKAVEPMAAQYPFTQLANLAGLPAMSVPLHWTPEGLPVGVQFVAPFGDEATLFRLAARLEEAKPWFDKLSPVAAGK